MTGAQEAHPQDLAARLDALAKNELGDLKTFLDQNSGFECGGILVEACRCLDHAHVIQMMTPHEHAWLPPQDFDIIVRGWNVLLSLLLERMAGYTGVPMAQSTVELRRMAMSLMHAAGRYVLYSRTAEMVRHGMVTGEASETDIEVWVSERAHSDHFHDHLDRNRMVQLREQATRPHRPDPQGAEGRRIVQQMAALTFPWDTPKGRMVGYTTRPEIDDFFLRTAADSAELWSAEAGISPIADLGGCSGEDLINVVLLLLSFYIKHVMFVEEAIKRHPGVNQHMSLTIWKLRSELIGSLVGAGAPPTVAEAALDLITVRPADAPFFMNEHMPGVPLAIEVADGYLLTPVSGIFRNPFHHIRMLRESTSPRLQNALRQPREQWMAEDLYQLFLGDRFQRVDGQVRLRRNGQTVTDIDAALFDNVTGELVLFQLKWQDFGTTSVRVQRSKAKNFTGQVESWGKKTAVWIDQFGTAALCKALKVKLPGGELPTVIRLWAVGRSNARFQSYGYTVGPQVLVLAWPQLIRLRLELGVGADLFSEITRRAVEEASTVPTRTAIPYVLSNRGVRVTFKDVWTHGEEVADSG